MQQRLQKYFFSLLTISSPTGNEQPCADFLLQTFSDYNPTQDATGNILVRIPGIGKPLIWTAHMDVVSPCELLEPVIEQGYIKNAQPHVLGIDNKAAIACFYEAIQQLQDKGGSHRPIELVFTIEEETTGKGALELSPESFTGTVGLSIDSAAPLGTIIYTSPYCYDLNWTIAGKTGHVKTLTNVNQYAWQALQEVIANSPFGALTEDTTINWSSVNGGHGRNTITESFQLIGEMRTFKKDEAEKILLEQSNLQSSLQEKYPELKITMHHPLINPGYEVDLQNTWMQTLQTAYTKLGITSELVKTYGVADANTWQSRGINIINLGSGAEFTHTKDERILVTDLEKTVDLLVELATI